MINIALCDDNKTSMKIISGSVAAIFEQNHIEANITMCASPKELIANIANNHVDLILLDIEMPGMDGIELGRVLREKNNGADIIFVSAREDRMYDAFSVQPFGFIRKSQFLKDTEKVIGAYIEHIKKSRSENGGHTILFKVASGGAVSVAVKDIIYVEGSLKNQNVYIRANENKEPLVINSTMKELEKALCNDGFMRIHSGYILNFAFLKGIKGNEVTLTTGAVLPVSRRNAAELKTSYLRYVKSHGGVTY